MVSVSQWAFGFRIVFGSPNVFQRSPKWGFRFRERCSHLRFPVPDRPRNVFSVLRFCGFLFTGKIHFAKRIWKMAIMLLVVLCPPPLPLFLSRYSGIRDTAGGLLRSLRLNCFPCLCFSKKMFWEGKWLIPFYQAGGLCFLGKGQSVRMGEQHDHKVMLRWAQKQAVDLGGG